MLIFFIGGDRGGRAKINRPVDFKKIQPISIVSTRAKNPPVIYTKTVVTYQEPPQVIKQENPYNPPVNKFNWRSFWDRIQP